MSSCVTYRCLLEGEIFGLAVAQAHLQHVEHVLIDVVGRGADDRDHLRVRAPPDGLHADKPSGAQRELQLLANLHVLHQTAEGASRSRPRRSRSLQHPSPWATPVSRRAWRASEEKLSKSCMKLPYQARIRLIHTTPLRPGRIRLIWVDMVCIRHSLI